MLQKCWRGLGSRLCSVMKTNSVCSLTNISQVLLHAFESQYGKKVKCEGYEYIFYTGITRKVGEGVSHKITSCLKKLE